MSDPNNSTNSRNEGMKAASSTLMNEQVNVDVESVF